MTEIGRGTVRSIVCDANLVVDVVPVDFVVDTLICASWHNATQQTDMIKIYNCTSSAVHPITWVYVRASRLSELRNDGEYKEKCNLQLQMARIWISHEEARHRVAVQVRDMVSGFHV